ncbi:hypothetical protein [Sphingorhabdus pulchriflava]|uniref:hypothetical protein n=1 Tax=Sphingorhabdus pulchriflava TaxID=2292257 RepID=UPI0011C060F9|nr:hypothetical protein [Sphingorhabdus pulchriflava]
MHDFVRLQTLGIWGMMPCLLWEATFEKRNPRKVLQSFNSITETFAVHIPLTKQNQGARQSVMQYLTTDKVYPEHNTASTVSPDYQSGDRK